MSNEANTNLAALSAARVSMNNLPLANFPMASVGDGAQAPINSEIRKAVEDALGALKYSLANVASDLSKEPAANTLEAEFKAVLKTFKPNQLSKLEQSAQALVNAPQAIRSIEFGRHGSLAPAQVRALGVAQMDSVLPAISLDSKLLGDSFQKISVDPDILQVVDTGLLIPNSFLTNNLKQRVLEGMSESAEEQPDLQSERMLDIWGPSLTDDQVAEETQLEANTRSTKLGLRITRVKCVDETNPEWWGKDEIAMGGLSVDENGDTKKINRQFVGKFNDGDQRTYNPINKLHWFSLLESHNHSGAKWPKRYNIALTLAEEDSGGFQSFLERVWRSLRDKVKNAISGAIKGVLSQYLGTVIAGAIGAAVAWAVDTLVGWLIRLFGDDIFRAANLHCTVPHPNARFSRSNGNGGSRSAPRRAHFSGHGGRYFVEYYWELYR